MEDQSVASWFQKYLLRSDLQPASVRFKRKAHDYFVEWFGDIPITAVTRDMAEDYRMMLAKDGRVKKTANGYFSNYRPFWSWLFRNGRIPSNPFADIRLFRITESRRKTFSAQELGWMVRTASRLWRVRICLGLLGMRRGEVLNLTVREINQSGPDSHILLSEKTRTETTWKWSIKDHAVRMIALPEIMRFAGYNVELHNDLVRLQEDLEDEQPYVCLERKYYRRLIERQRQNNLSEEELAGLTADPTRNYQRSFRRVQTNAGIRQLRRFHELRAAFATKMISKQGIERAADALGHSSVEITRRYDRRTESELTAEIGRMAASFYES